MPIQKLITTAELLPLIPIHKRVTTKWCSLAVVAMIITLTVGLLAIPVHAGVVYVQPSSDTLLFQILISNKMSNKNKRISFVEARFYLDSDFSLLYTGLQYSTLPKVS